MRLINDYSYYHVILWNRAGYIRHYDMLFLSFEFLDEDFEFVMFLKFEFPNDILNPNIRDLTDALNRLYAVDIDTFTVLTPIKDAPIYKERADERIYSFSCNLKYFRSVFEDMDSRKFSTNNLLFEILDQILENPTFGKILVRQIPIVDVNPVSAIESDIIIPHRGNNIFLNSLLLFLDQIENINVFVGIDQLVNKDIFKMVKEHPNQNLYSFEPNPMGPYVLRNWLIEQGNSKIIFFQDSDDFCCSDRFERISDFMFANSCQLCGSHEIKLDYYDRTVQAYRYPLNVSDALKNGPGHSLLHPASGILRESFYACGKLSEERIFGNDTKFLYNSYFVLNCISNIDEFLYFRRRRPNSLTTSPGTEIGSSARIDLLLSWIAEFAALKAGEKKQEESILKYEPPKYRFRVKRLG